MKINQDTLDTIYHKLNDIEQKLDSFLLENHKSLSYLFMHVEDMTEWENFEELPALKEYINEETTLLLVRDFLFSLNPKYSNSFINDLDKIEVNKKSYYTRYLFSSWYRIYYSQNFNMDDGTSLTHEYLHHLASHFPKLKIDTSAHTTYTESLSILGELKYLDFLKSIGFSQYEINIQIKSIRKRVRNDTYAFLSFEPLLDVYLSKEKLTMDKMDELVNCNPFYKAIGKEGTAHNINLLASEKNYQEVLDYKHSLGMIQATSLHQDGISNEDFVNLIETINTVEIDEFEKLLPQKTKIELARDTANEFNFQFVKK